MLFWQRNNKTTLRSHNRHKHYIFVFVSARCTVHIKFRVVFIGYMFGVFSPTLPLILVYSFMVGMFVYVSAFD